MDNYNVLDGEDDVKAGILLDKAMTEIYNILREEYDARTSREAIEETIIANEYTFLENGNMFN